MESPLVSLNFDKNMANFDINPFFHNKTHLLFMILNSTLCQLSFYASYRPKVEKFELFILIVRKYIKKWDLAMNILTFIQLFPLIILLFWVLIIILNLFFKSTQVYPSGNGGRFVKNRWKCSFLGICPFAIINWNSSSSHIAFAISTGNFLRPDSLKSWYFFDKSKLPCTINILLC